MLHVSFNQDSTCFACSNENGFIVYNCDPPNERFNRLKSENINGVSIIEMLFRSNIFVLVGDENNEKYPPNVLIVWDDFQNKCIAELQFKSNITGVSLRRDSILVMILDKAYLYNFSDLKLLKTFDTFENERGLGCITTCENTLIALPGNSIGTVIINDYTINKQHIISAHQNKIAAMSLNNNGTLLATASNVGTLIRIWNTETGEKLNEFRRGIDVVTIKSLSFNNNDTQLLVSSDKGTIHIFSLKNEENKKSRLSYISNYLPEYFNSEWSFISFNIPFSHEQCTFGTSENIINILSKDKFYKYQYNIDNESAYLKHTLELRCC